MITVIIPTLLKVDRLHQTLKELSECDVVGEIIVIDNTDNLIPFELPKLKYICEGKNTYVNSAWNKGVGLSSFDKVCIMNDDIWFDFKYLEKVSDFLTEDIAMIGMGISCYTENPGDFKIEPVQPYPEPNDMFITSKIYRTAGYGCCFFIHKNNWDVIPDELKIWCGDDWIFYRTNKIKYCIEGLKCEGQVSSTVDSCSEDIENVKLEDVKNIKKLIKDGRIPNYIGGTAWDR